jgi:hypothetical protein
VARGWLAAGYHHGTRVGRYLRNPLSPSAGRVRPGGAP